MTQGYLYFVDPDFKNNANQTIVFGRFTDEKKFFKSMYQFYNVDNARGFYITVENAGQYVLDIINEIAKDPDGRKPYDLERVKFKMYELKTTRRTDKQYTFTEVMKFAQNLTNTTRKKSIFAKNSVKKMKSYFSDSFDFSSPKFTKKSTTNSQTKKMKRTKKSSSKSHTNKMKKQMKKQMKEMSGNLDYFATKFNEYAMVYQTPNSRFEYYYKSE